MAAQVSGSVRWESNARCLDYKLSLSALARWLGDLSGRGRALMIPPKRQRSRRASIAALTTSTTISKLSAPIGRDGWVTAKSNIPCEVADLRSAVSAGALQLGH